VTCFLKCINKATDIPLEGAKTQVKRPKKMLKYLQYRLLEIFFAEGNSDLLSERQLPALSTTRPQTNLAKTLSKPK